MLQKFDDLWDLLDAESTSFMAYEDFMRYYLGEMNEYRKYIVIKVQLLSGWLTCKISHSFQYNLRVMCG